MPNVLHAPRAAAARRSADQLWALATMALAAASIVLALIGSYDAGAVVGALAVVTGGWSMLISRTTGERFETVIATVAAAVALAACLAYGSGFSV
jgi:hypothetical protein